MSGSKENKQEALQKENEYKVTWKGWVSLAFLIISFSGLVAHQDNFLKAFDLMNLMGQFGHADGAKIAMQGTGGFGAREGFAFALTMVPVTMLAQGLIETCEHLGALKAAGKLFQPFLRFLLGIPGVAGLAFISSFTSSDIGAFMTKNLYEEGMMNDDFCCVSVCRLCRHQQYHRFRSGTSSYLRAARRRDYSSYYCC